MNDNQVLLQGNNLEVLKDLPENSIDSVVTDPPYGLSFMGKKWDYDVPTKELWIEVFRVLKPGGHLLSFGGTRTYHRMVCAIEDAGFDIRDQVQWLYGVGFPKSHNLDGEHQGWGTALKPANEPICLARKPLEKGLTVAENVEKWGTGAINIDASRIPTTDNLNGGTYSGSLRSMSSQDRTMDGGIMKQGIGKYIQPDGRWPANIILDEQAAELLDEQSGHNSARGGNLKKQSAIGFANEQGRNDNEKVVLNDSGGASRFFYVAKASKRERNAGLEGMPEKAGGLLDQRPSGDFHSRLGDGPTAPKANHHPTVKPVKLMEYLCRMITPPGGVILDPFMGSGTTGIAAKNLNFGFIGIELDIEYHKIAAKRIESA